ncbi:MAM domain-containing protein 2 [Chanos chanos]|uniref:MAM domain-containing protein 2 n=1 Tax=Chanos chanos TaxID=29144 RepID=A0A6J2UTE9_CHACN|nr:MAM domain-containing protein 2-like [Chanos chanos]
MFYLLHFLSLTVVAEAAVLSGSCRFEDSTCNYTSDPAFSSWTLDTNGHFITVDSPVQDGLGKAVLLGPDVDQQDWSCLRVVYQIIVGGSLHILRRAEGESFDHVLWTTQNPSNSWLIASIDLQNSTDPYKIVIEGTPGEAKGSSVSIFEIHISDKYCIECDFEEPHMCGYSNQWNSNVNWYVGISTAQDHQGNQPEDKKMDGTGHYMYVDSVHAETFQEVAKLVSPMTTVPISGCLTFQYQQSHAEGHLFSVYSRDQVGQYQELWRAGMPGDNQVDWGTEFPVWIPVQVNFRAPYPVQVVFEVTFNSPKGGHVVLDDISFSPEFCNAEMEPTFDPTVANCDFETGFCHYTQSLMDSPTWKRVSLRPNIYRAGDHTTGAGSFLLANTRLGLQSGYVSRLYGPLLPAKQKYCLKFYYSLRGFVYSNQPLTVYLYDKAGVAYEKVWTQAEKTRNVWIAADVTIQTERSSKVVFVSTCKSFWNCGSVALDDISMSLGDCGPTEGSALSVPSQCDFEMGFCGYTQDKESDMGDWVLGRGPTPTSFTGPRGDHTSGVGNYVYIEASLMLPGHNARLLSSSLRGSRVAQCLRFYYHMYGSGTGQLNVLLRSAQEAKDMLLWTRSGEQGISWLRATINYQHEHQHQIVFEATRGSSVRSDIAIDDIMFLKGACPAQCYICFSVYFHRN